MQHRHGNLPGPDDARIFYQYWQPDTAKAVLLIVHGAGEHSGRYQRFAEYFVAREYAVAALDLPGHGQSAGSPGFVAHFDNYLDALRQFSAQVAKDFASLPIFLLGHSMGGLIGTNYLAANQADFVGGILSGPAIKSDLQPNWLQMLVIRLLSRLAPRVGALQLDASGVSRDPEEVKRYLDDPLVYNGKLSARMLAEMFRGMSQALTTANQIRLPLLLMHGGDDQMTSPEGSRYLYNTVSSTDKTLKIYPHLYHEIFNEPEREQVFADLAEWCAQRLPA